MKTLLAGEIENQVYVVEVERDVFFAQLRRGSALCGIDWKALAVDVRPARHEQSGAADVDLVAQTIHRAAARGDSNRIQSRRVPATKKGELLTRLEVAVRAVFGKMSDLRASGGRDESKRNRASEMLH